MRRLLLALLCAVAGPAMAEPLTLTPKERQQIEAGLPVIRKKLDAMLLDYPSARFRDVHIHVDPEIGAKGARFCGFANSKNRMGAYVGWTPFFGMADVGGEPWVEVEENGVLETTLCKPTDQIDTKDYSEALKHR